MLKDTFAHKGLRKNLIDQLRLKGISSEEILDAFNRIPRHFFLDSAFSKQAYQDIPFSIGEGQTISQPFTVAFQTELLDVKPRQKVLEIGSGSGFQSCILLSLGVILFSIETIASLHKRAVRIVELMGLHRNAYFACSDGTLGWPAKAPFDRILVTAGAPSIPGILIEQLAIGGKLVIPVGDDKTQKMLRITRESEKTIRKEEFGNFSFVKLKGTNGWQ